VIVIHMLRSVSGRAAVGIGCVRRAVRRAITSETSATDNRCLCAISPACVCSRLMRAKRPSLPTTTTGTRRGGERVVLGMCVCSVHVCTVVLCARLCLIVCAHRLPTPDAASIERFRKAKALKVRVTCEMARIAFVCEIACSRRIAGDDGRGPR
jgi:hypothetical protein